MQSKKINELATNVAPSVNDLTVIGDASTGQLKKITLSQISSLFGGTGSVSSVAMTVPTGLTVTGSPITTSGTLAVTLTAGYSIPTTAKQTEWDLGYSERLKWDGGSSGLSAPTARTSLGLVIGTDVLAYRTFGSAANNNTADFATAAQGVSADTAFSLRLTGASLPLSISSNVISIAQSSSTISGFLSSTDWNTFNGKQQALNGTGFVKATGTTITYDNSTYLTTGNAASTYLTISNASSTYLPLAGGTLTGALGGTSATFSASGQSLQLTSASDVYLNVTRGSSILNIGNDATSAFYVTNTSHRFYVNSGTINALTIASTGAATFISSVTATQGIFSNVSSITNSDQSGARLVISNTGSGGQAVNLVAGNPNVDNTGFSIAYGNTNFLRFASSGAATFSSSIAATSATFSGILTTPQVKAATSAGLSINANSGTQVADFGAGGSANITFFGGLNGTSATFSGLLTNYNVFNTQTANYTLVLADASKIVEMNVASANTVTIPTNASVAFPIGTEITVMQYGAGNTTIVAASGVTFRSKDFGTRIGDQYTGATLIKRGTNEWYLIGNIQP